VARTFSSVGSRAPDLGEERLHLLAQIRAQAGDLLGDAGRNEFRGEALPQPGFVNQGIRHAEAVAGEDLRCAVVEQGEAGAVEHNGHAAKEALVENLRLGEVGQLGRPPKQATVGSR
jgi:hypothetical protein